MESLPITAEPGAPIPTHSTVFEFLKAKLDTVLRCTRLDKAQHCIQLGLCDDCKGHLLVVFTGVHRSCQDSVGLCRTSSAQPV